MTPLNANRHPKCKPKERTLNALFKSLLDAAFPVTTSIALAEKGHCILFHLIIVKRLPLQLSPLSLYV